MSHICCAWPSCESPGLWPSLLSPNMELFCYSHWGQLTTEQQAEILYGSGGIADRVRRVVEDLLDAIPY